MAIRLKPWLGHSIENPGIYAGMPIGVYHSAKACIEPSISSTGLRRIFRQSPAYYWAFSVYNPDRYDDDETPSQILGAATHDLLLSEVEFRKVFAIRPDRIGGVRWSGRGAACEAWLRQNADKRIITSTQYEQIRGIAKALKKERLIRHGILNGEIETSYVWKDRETGVWCKTRPDASPNDSLDFADLKTCTSVAEEELRRSISSYGYFQQAGLHAEACVQCTGMKMNSFTLVFVESKPPHCVAIRTLKDNEIERGHRANQHALRIFADCMASGKWPGPHGEQEDAQYIEMTPWDQRAIDEKISALDNTRNSLRDRAVAQRRA
jgi:hypothetical protein